jgi:hypothetical protein
MQSLQKYDGCMIFWVEDIYFKFAQSGSVLNVPGVLKIPLSKKLEKCVGRWGWRKNLKRAFCMQRWRLR